MTRTLQTFHDFLEKCEAKTKNESKLQSETQKKGIFFLCPTLSAGTVTLTCFATALLHSI